MLGNHTNKFLAYVNTLLPPLLKNEGDGKKVGKIAEILYVDIRVLNTGKEINLKVYMHICKVGKNVFCVFLRTVPATPEATPGAGHYWSINYVSM